MSDFVSNKLKQIDLGNEKWIKIPEEISFGQVQNFTSGEKDESTMALKAMVTFIKEWNLKDGDDIAELNEENIKRLKIEDVNIISEAITGMIQTVDKKKEDSNSGKQ